VGRFKQQSAGSGRWEDVRQGEEERRRYWDRTEQVVGALIEVHRRLGPGLLESAYEACICRELVLRGPRLRAATGVAALVQGEHVDCGYRADLIVEGRVLVELKTVERLQPLHVAQVITYLRLSGIPVGLLVTFNVRILKHGIRRLWLADQTSFSPSLLLSLSPLSRLPTAIRGREPPEIRMRPLLVRE
jgi:GxxExxY protein